MPDTNFTHPMRKWEDILTIVSGKNQKNVEEYQRGFCGDGQTGNGRRQGNC